MEMPDRSLTSRAMVREFLCRLGRHPIQEMNVLVCVKSGHRLWARALGVLHDENA